ncbi:MAG: hypothetical protein WC383_15225 [Gammaproteobacteria bacterium]
MSIRVRRWHYICRTYSGAWPGIAPWWDIFIGRSPGGIFYVRVEGKSWEEEEQDGSLIHTDGSEVHDFEVGDERALIAWLEDRCLPSLPHVSAALEGLPGFERLTKMIAFRIRDRRSIRRVAGGLA